jgi:hypothetical protein
MQSKRMHMAMLNGSLSWMRMLHSFSPTRAPDENDDEAHEKRLKALDALNDHRPERVELLFDRHRPQMVQARSGEVEVERQVREEHDVQEQVHARPPGAECRHDERDVDEVERPDPQDAADVELRE